MNDHYYTRVPHSESRPVDCGFTYRGEELTFRTDAGVFSKGEMDTGTRLLLEALPEDETVDCFPPEIPEDITDAYFIKLALTGADGRILSENFYWEGREKGNWQALRSLGRTKLRKNVEHVDGNTYKVTVKNTGRYPALMIRLKAVDGATGCLSLPVWYSDNYFFLMPGESREVTVTVPELKGRLKVETEGINSYI